MVKKHVETNTHIIKKQPLNKMTAKMLIIKIICEKAEHFWRTNVNIAILQQNFFEVNKPVIEQLLHTVNHNHQSTENVKKGIRREIGKHEIYCIKLLQTKIH